MTIKGGLNKIVDGATPSTTYVESTNVDFKDARHLTLIVKMALAAGSTQLNILPQFTPESPDKAVADVWSPFPELAAAADANVTLPAGAGHDGGLLSRRISKGLLLSTPVYAITSGDVIEAFFLNCNPIRDFRLWYALDSAVTAPTLDIWVAATG